MPPEKRDRLVVGASQGIGLALVASQLADPSLSTITATHRPSSNLTALKEMRERHGERLYLQELDVSDEISVQNFANAMTQRKPDFELIIHAAGVLHENGIQPEKSLSQCNAENLRRLFDVNSIGPLMVAKAILPLQSRSKPMTFAALSAMVGSIGDNRLGGWYGYRASKAALNQFIRTLANECRISHPQAAIVTMHPGTTDTRLSKPFQRNIDEHRLYTREQTAERILAVLGGLDAKDSGQFFNWDGSSIPW